jgi:hypothetical protein
MVMPLFQYFGWVGSFLLAALFAANCCCSVPIARPPRSDVPRDQKINIRIHTDHKWPERVVFDTTRSTLTDEVKANAETGIGRSETPVLADRQPFDAFAKMAAISARPCFRPPCSVSRTAEREASPIEKGAASQNRSRFQITARKSLTSPNRLHKPPGRS